MPKLINLQNTPTIESVSTEAVSFDSNGVTLKGTLYKPAKNAAGTRFPGAIVTGAWTTVKEQMAGTYARELAARGMIALAFDFTGWGESISGVEANSRYVEDPKVKTADIVSAANYMLGREDVDNTNLSGLGVCASSGYMAAAVADNKELQKVALVAPWLHDPPLAEGIYGGPEAASKLLAAAAESSDDPTLLVCGSTTDSAALMYEAPYYSEEHRGLISAYDNQFNVLSWKPWLTYNAQDSAERLTKPLLMVGSDSIALLAGAKAYEARTMAPLEKVWLKEDVTQFDFYDRDDAVVAAADAVAKFFQK